MDDVDSALLMAAARHDIPVVNSVADLFDLEASVEEGACGDVVHLKLRPNALCLELMAGIMLRERLDQDPKEPHREALACASGEAQGVLRHYCAQAVETGPGEEYMTQERGKSIRVYAVADDFTAQPWDSFHVEQCEHRYVGRIGDQVFLQAWPQRRDGATG